MIAISAADVKRLRELSGAGVIDCRNALVEAAGDLEGALEQLRVRESAKAAKLVKRAAKEGVVALVVEEVRAAMIELNAETDFVGKNETFLATARAFAAIALRMQGNHEALLAAASPDGDGRVADLVARTSARTGEKISLRRSAFVTVGQGLVGAYVHGASAPGVGRIGVLVGLESAARVEVLDTLGRQIAMHVAASAPEWVSLANVPAAVLDQKRAELEEDVRASGKPSSVAVKIVEGRLRKFLDAVVLERQPFVLDEKTTVSEVIATAAASAGAPIAVTSFARFKTGEGIQNDE